MQIQIPKHMFVIDSRTGEIYMSSDIPVADSINAMCHALGTTIASYGTPDECAELIQECGEIVQRVVFEKRFTPTGNLYLM